MRSHSRMVLLALAAALVAVWAGVPASSVLVLAAVLVCPLMMIFMMRGMHHDTSGHDGDRNGNHHDVPTSTRR